VRSAVVIGNGNVAIDVVRILAKTPEELAQSDMAPAIGHALAAAPLGEIHIVGRRGPSEAGFSPKELGELGELARAQPVVRAADLPAAETAPNPAVIAILRDFASRKDEAKPVTIRFHFHLRPAAFSGPGRIAAARFMRADGGADLALPADLAVSCIGYRAVACDALVPDGVFANESGRIAPGLYVVGWAKRGPSGTIATNRAEAHEVAQRLAAETVPSERRGREGLSRLLAERDAHPVDYAGWLRIDAAERAHARPGRPRVKFADLAALIESAKKENS
jgi:ferredoxin--NADP+ reductase